MRLLLLICVLTAVPLAAMDVATSDNDNLWALLENPYNANGQPGLPNPTGFDWPGGAYPECELWRFDRKAKTWTQETDVLGKHDKPRATWQRMLHDPFLIDGQAYVMHYDAYSKTPSTVVKVTDALAKAEGKLPSNAGVLALKNFCDAPVVSPDAKHLALRVFVRDGNAYRTHLAVYRVSDWSRVAISNDAGWARPIWADNATLTAVAFDSATAPKIPIVVKKFGKLYPNHKPKPEAGKLQSLTLADGKLTPKTLLADTKFPPDYFARHVVVNPLGAGVVVAHALTKGVAVSLIAEGKATQLATFDQFLGLANLDGLLLAAGVQKRQFTLFAKAKEKVVGELLKHALTGREVNLDEDDHSVTLVMPWRSDSGVGGFCDFGAHAGFIEATANPDCDRDDEATHKYHPMLRFTLSVPSMAGYDSMDNPACLGKLSALAKRFIEAGRIENSVLAFDLNIKVDDKRIKKKTGLYVELWSRKGRKGKGRIRTEDNLSGDWVVNAVTDDDQGNDFVYTWADIKKPNPQATSSDRSGVYDDLITQIDTRRLLMLSNADKAYDEGGLRFMTRGIYSDPIGGTKWRVWLFERRGKAMKDAGYERAVLAFVADLPEGSAGDWAYPHALVRARVNFALANNRKTAQTDLAFEPGRWAVLPNGRGKDLLFPKVFRVFQFGKDGKPEEQFRATLKTEEFALPKEIRDDTKGRCGVNQSGSESWFTKLAR